MNDKEATMRMSALAPLRAHLRWTFAAWRSAHPLLLAAFGVCAWGLYRFVRDAQEGWGWFSFESALDRETLGQSLLVGFLVSVIQDGTGRDDPSLGYQVTRPLGRTAILSRSVLTPLAAGALVFLVWTPARDYRENVRLWWPDRRGWAVFSSMFQDSRAMSREKVSFWESRHRAWIPGSRVEQFKSSGLSPMAGGYEYWYRNPEKMAESEARDRMNPRKTRQQREDSRNFRRGFDDYRLWREGKGPLTEALRKRGWWTVVLPFNMHWYMWGSWYLMFAGGVLLRAWMTFGRESGALGSIRRAVTVRNIVPVALLLYAVRADRWLPYPGPAYGWSVAGRFFVAAYQHGALYLAAAVALIVVPAILLHGGWNRRDIG